MLAPFSNKWHRDRDLTLVQALKKNRRFHSLTESKKPANKLMLTGFSIYKWHRDRDLNPSSGVEINRFFYHVRESKKPANKLMLTGFSIYKWRRDRDLNPILSTKTKNKSLIFSY